MKIRLVFLRWFVLVILSWLTCEGGGWTGWGTPSSLAGSASAPARRLRLAWRLNS